MKVQKQKFSSCRIFPQADVLYKVLEIAVMFNKGKHDKLDIYSQIGVTTERQIKYYQSAAHYIGLLNENGSLSEIGRLFVNQKNDTKLELLVFLVLSSDIFNEYFRDRSKGNTILRLIEQYGLSQNTAKRRFLTVENWINTCDIIISDYKISIEMED